MKRIWILNHYATKQYAERGGRHYWLSRKLIERGYIVDVFAASTIHGAAQRSHVRGTDIRDGIRYTFLDTPSYAAATKRLLNILTYYFKLMRTGKRASTPPDIIYASSVHPLALLAGIRLAKYYGVPCICEVRDLWPLSIEAHFPQVRNTLLTRMLYRGERWLYERADQLIFTMDGGAQYIADNAWGSSIKRHAIHHINNGIDLPTFDALAKSEKLSDPDLDSDDVFTVVYAGSIRLVNRVDILLETARELDARGVSDVKLLIYGDGDKRAELARQAEGISSIRFKGAIPKTVVPELLRKADAAIFHADEGLLSRYGTSMNKLPEYFASGTPVISDCRFGYDPIELHRSGIVVPNGSPADLADSIQTLKSLPSVEYNAMSQRAREAAKLYDFQVLTDKLEQAMQSAYDAPPV